MGSVFGWSLPPGCGTLPGEESQPPSCEDCPEEQYDNCPGQDNCIEVILDGRPACCVKHKREMVDGECGYCETDVWREIERDNIRQGYGYQDLTKSWVRAYWLRVGISIKDIEQAYLSNRGIEVR